MTLATLIICSGCPENQITSEPPPTEEIILALQHLARRTKAALYALKEGDASLEDDNENTLLNSTRSIHFILVHHLDDISSSRVLAFQSKK